MAKQPSNGRKTPQEPKTTAAKAQSAPESSVDSAPVVDKIPAEVHANTASSPKAPAAKPAVPAAEKATKPAPPPSAAAPAAPVQQNSFLPLALGGLIAGVIGFAVATFTAPAPDNMLSNQVAAQSSAISSLEERIAGVGSTDLSGIETSQAALSSEIADLSSALDEIGARLDALEARPAQTVASGDVAGVTGEMDALRAQIAEMTGAAQTELEEARAAAASIEENAAAAARNAAARAALSRVQTALESGAPIGAALADLEDATGSSAPQELLAVQDGVPTLGSLQEQFPDVARTALATARSEGVSGEETTGFAAFLRSQLDVRSTVAREGTDADAVLSRAEAAVRSGRLTDALAEVSALPEVVRADMSDWLGQAEARASAIAAVDILSSTLSDN